MNLRRTEIVRSIKIQISLLSYHPACYSDRPHPPLSSLGHVHFCPCQGRSFGIDEGDMRRELIIIGGQEGLNSVGNVDPHQCQKQIFRDKRMSFCVCFSSAKSLTFLLQVYVLCSAISAAFMHLPQETGQHRPAVSSLL